jgi:hypothetical protein
MLFLGWKNPAGVDLQISSAQSLGLFVHFFAAANSFCLLAASILAG